ncbi:MAG: hypothetical protein GF341_08715 [candidate division Zixibacteria bacterium]|nr:hypothetical protein [candidate division Zixibacteria bacterium]
MSAHGGQEMLKQTRTITRTTTLLIAILVGGLYPTTADSGEPKLTSQWNADTIAIDGIESEWSDSWVYWDDINVGLGVRNDGEFIYVHLATTDEMAIRQMLALGLIVWFDPDGGDDKVFGVRYRTGLGGSGALREFAGKRPDRDDLIALSDSLAPEMELLDEQGEVIQRVQTGARSDLNAQLTMENGRLAYELQVPLYYSEGHPYAVGSIPGANIGVGFETPKPDLDREQMAKIRDGMRGRGGRFGGRGGFGRRVGNRPERPEPLNQWTTVELAEDPTSQVN